MASPITRISKQQSMRTGAFGRAPTTPHPQVVPIEFFNPPQGLDLRHGVSRLGTALSPQMENLRLKDDWFSVRPGTEVLGAAAGSNVIHVVIFTTAIGTEHIVRWTQTGVDYYNGGAWSALSGPVLTLSEYSVISTTAWNSKLLFADGWTGIYEINFNDFTYALVTGAPICKHITTFAGRVIASYIFDPVLGELPSREQWCVKGNNTDWTGLGSGYEDLLNSPGGTVDIQLGVYPISDTSAFIVRSNSIWLMEQTGFFDTPFSFNSLYHQLKIDSQQSVIATTGGIYVLTRDDVYFLGINQPPVPIGSLIRAGLHTSVNRLLRAVLAYDAYEKALLVYIPKVLLDGTSMVYRFYTESKRWTRDEYPCDIKFMGSHLHQRTLSIAELTGTIEDLEGPISELGIQTAVDQLLFCTIGNLVIRETGGLTDDVDNTGSSVPIAFELVTPEITPKAPMLRASIVQSVFEYAASQAVDLLVEESEDAGVSYSTYGTETTSASGQGSQILTMSKFIDRARIMLKLSSTDAAGFKLRDWIVQAHDQSAPKQL